MSRLPFLLLAVLAGATACASGPSRAQAAATSASAASAPVHPLADFARLRVAVAPAQRLRQGDSLGFATAAGDAGAWLAKLDDEITFALGERGLRPGWAMPAEVARALRRNPNFDVDAHALAVEELRGTVRRGGPELSAALSSQLRAISALEDARYVLVPVELRFEGPRGAARAVLHVVLLDARSAQVAWLGDVPGDPSPSFSPALAASVAGHLADLISAAP